MKELSVYLVRHGESANNARGCHDVAVLDEVDGREPVAKCAKIERNPDPDLTDRGRAQAEATAYLFEQLCADPAMGPGLRPNRIFVSGFTRALNTCRPIAARLGLTPELRLDIHEEGGVFEGPRRNRGDKVWTVRHGLDAQGMRGELPTLSGLSGIPAEGWWRGGVESSEEVTVRAAGCAEWLWSLLAEETRPSGSSGAVVCVTHGLFIDRWLKALLGLPPTSQACTFLSANCAYWLINLRLDESATVPRQAGFYACNVVDHIPMAVRTGHVMKGRSHCQPSYSSKASSEPEEDTDKAAKQGGSVSGI